MKLEVIRMIRFLLALLLGARTAPVAHLELQHAHWDRDAQRWVTHEGEAEVIPSQAA